MDNTYHQEVSTEKTNDTDHTGSNHSNQLEQVVDSLPEGLQNELLPAFEALNNMPDTERNVKAQGVSQVITELVSNPSLVDFMPAASNYMNILRNSGNISNMDPQNVDQILAVSKATDSINELADKMFPGLAKLFPNYTKMSPDVNNFLEELKKADYFNKKENGTLSEEERIRLEGLANSLALPQPSNSINISGSVLNGLFEWVNKQIAPSSSSSNNSVTQESLKEYRDIDMD